MDNLAEDLGITAEDLAMARQMQSDIVRIGTLKSPMKRQIAKFPKPPLPPKPPASPKFSTLPPELRSIIDDFAAGGPLPPEPSNLDPATARRVRKYMDRMRQIAQDKRTGHFTPERRLLRPKASPPLSPKQYKDSDFVDLQPMSYPGQGEYADEFNPLL